ncbi:xanthine dehydrogenase family protein molybdopterin-binding subunit [Fonticella tunisiensis]|uniref:CO/xanthine dehydrogenase Mo-binding subunit n=1 Tax=Fonticella tunisiensis TaxID=1096341 RepID=A0A4R7KV75_9CLOT|nr:molybdopterin cofactor-binding domain-containing protein [Fonticella tunisiensis]TDT63664.1 CO/xanthine dehydrogenase Mo-binding subunit [Fonticella tunisiensis]
MKEVNKSVPKKDGMGLTVGKPAYTEDLAPQNALTVKVLRSPYPFARIKNIDTEKAEKLKGVKCVLTYKNVPRNIVTRAGQGYPEPSPHDKFILDEYVRYIGDEVAAVAAEDEVTAVEALKLIEVEYEKLEPVLDFERAEGHPSIIHPEKEAHEMFPTGFNPSKNIAAEYHMSFGDLDKTLKKCDYVVSERYYTQAQNHTAMETHSSFAYVDINGRLNIVSSTQTPFHARRIVGEALGLPLDKIRVIKPRIGGGYGGKQALHGEFLVALVALRTGRSAKLIYTREEVFEATYTRHPMRIDVTIGADKDGNIKAIDMEILSNTGAYAEHALTVFMVAGSKTLPLYNKAEAVRFGGKVVYTNHTPAGAFRGYGAVQGNFALEATIDKLALAVGKDPVEFRVQNMIKEGETSPVFKIMGEGTEGVDMTVDSCKLEYCVKRGMELCGWKDKYPRKQIGKNKVRGIGSAIAMQGSGIPCIDMGSAVIKLNDGGFFNLMVGATDIGTGSDTILAQIAAEALGVSTDKVVVYSSDTDLTPFDCGAYASSTTYVSGNAVYRAGRKMKGLIEKAGAERFGVSKDEVEFDGEFIRTKDGRNSVSLSQLSTELYYSNKQKQLMVCESFCGEVSPPPFLAGFAEVEVDLETGKVDLIDYTAVVDCGTPINPNLARIQIEGGLVQGIGMTMFEGVKYGENGKLLTNNFLQYRIPSRKDINKLTVEFAESYEPSGPFGAKSVGEIGTDTPPAAITNAIYNAIGVRVTKLPVTPEYILMELKKKMK